MSDTTKERKGLTLSEVQGALPAWIWRGVTFAEREAQGSHFPVTVIQDAGARFVLIDAEHFNQILRQEREAK